jgi:D-alanine transaminase
MNTVFLNNEFMSQDKARISPLDRGFLFGDGIYEVLPVYKGKCFLAKEHFERMHQSLDAIKLFSPLSDEEWHAVFDRLIQDNGAEQTIYLQITRGVAQKRTHQFPQKVVPTVFAMSGSPIQVKTQGITTITAPDTRWKFCNIKSINLLPNVLYRQMADEQDAEEAILIRDGLVTEGCLSNIFIIKEGVMITHPNEPGILPGITRKILLDIAHQHQIPCEEREIHEEELFTADEVWSTGTGKEITAVIKINDTLIGSSKPGPLWKKMYEYFQEAKVKVAGN